jgi:hypothetical protein
MAMVSTQTRGEPNMWVTGRMIHSRDKELKLGLRAQSMKANTRKDRSRASELTTGLMAVSTTEIGKITRLMVRANTSGKMVVSITAAGKTMTWTAWVFTFIPTV